MTQREAQNYITKAGNLLALILIAVIAGYYPTFEQFDLTHALLGTGFLAGSAVIIGLVATRMLPTRKDVQNAGN